MPEGLVAEVTESGFFDYGLVLIMAKMHCHRAFQGFAWIRLKFVNRVSFQFFVSFCPAQVLHFASQTLHQKLDVIYFLQPVFH